MASGYSEHYGKAILDMKLSKSINLMTDLDSTNILLLQKKEKNHTHTHTLLYTLRVKYGHTNKNENKTHKTAM